MRARAGILALAAIVAALALVGTWPRKRILELPAGVVELRSELAVGPDTEVRGARGGTTLRFAPGFTGRALIVVVGSRVTLHNFRIEGDRDTNDLRQGLAPYDVPFARFTRGNGVLAEGVGHLRVEHLEFTRMRGFAVLVSRARDVAIASVTVTDSGSHNAEGRNNATGGILLEEGTRNFRVTGCALANIRGNGIWTHSLYTSPRNGDGTIAGNRFLTVGRDAIQVGHAFDVRVEENSGRRIGFPAAEVDLEGRAFPVGVDTAGNVDRSVYAGNRFEELDGKCFDLDGFHDGEISGNVCINRGAPESYPFGNYAIVMNNTNPDMRSQNIRITGNTIDGTLFGGIFVIGTGHTIAHNLLRNINASHCNESAARFGCYYAPGEPDMLRSGIYLGRGAERQAPARGNTMEDNEIQGYRMKTRCVVSAPGILDTWNTSRRNRCE